MPTNADQQNASRRKGEVKGGREREKETCRGGPILKRHGACRESSSGSRCKGAARIHKTGSRARARAHPAALWSAVLGFFQYAAATQAACEIDKITSAWPEKAGDARAKASCCSSRRRFANTEEASERKKERRRQDERQFENGRLAPAMHESACAFSSDRQGGRLANIEKEIATGEKRARRQILAEDEPLEKEGPAVGGVQRRRAPRAAARRSRANTRAAASAARAPLHTAALIARRSGRSIREGGAATRGRMA